MICQASTFFPAADIVSCNLGDQHPVLNGLLIGTEKWCELDASIDCDLT